MGSKSNIELEQYLKEFVDNVEKDLNYLEQLINIIKMKEEFINHLDNLLDVSFDKSEDIKLIKKELDIITIDTEQPYNPNFLDFISYNIRSYSHEFVSYHNDERYLSLLENIKRNPKLIDLNSERQYARGMGVMGIDTQNEPIVVFNEIFFNIDMYISTCLNFIRNFKTLKSLSSIKNNIVIIGANGSGKSTLSRQLATQGSNGNINIIASQHLLYLQDSDFTFTSSGEKSYNVETYQESNKIIDENEVFDSDAYSFELHNLVNQLLLEHFEHLNNEEKGESKLKIIVNIFNNILGKSMIIKNNTLKCINQDDDEYNFNQLSDGERQVFYFLANCISYSKEKPGYIIVDEPENHLNRQVSVTLWNKLENVLPKCTFVYITHDPQFASSRLDTTLIWSKKYKHPYEWEFKEITDKKIPEETLIEVLGSKQNVLFCEGNENSLDYKIYTALFKNYKIIPVEGHKNVIHYTKVVNELPYEIHINARGIIDRDGKLELHDSYNRKSNIFVLPVNEIEMFFICDELLEAMKENFSALSINLNVDQFKNHMFKYMNEKIHDVLINHLVQSTNDLLENKKINLKEVSDVDSINNHLTEIVSNMDLQSEYDKLEEKIKEIIVNKNYDELLKICNLKNEILKSEVKTKLLSNLNPDIYINAVITQISQNDELRNKLVKTYFADLIN